MDATGTENYPGSSSFLKHIACCFIAFPGTSNLRSWCQSKSAAAPTAERGRPESVALCDPGGPCLCHCAFQVRGLEAGGPGQRLGAEGLLSQKKSPIPESE